MRLRKKQSLLKIHTGVPLPGRRMYTTLISPDCFSPQDTSHNLILSFLLCKQANESPLLKAEFHSGSLQRYAILGMISVGHVIFRKLK